MLSNLKEQPADKILALMQAFREDPRDTKVDLGVPSTLLARRTPSSRSNNGSN